MAAKLRCTCENCGARRRSDSAEGLPPAAEPTVLARQALDKDVLGYTPEQYHLGRQEAFEAGKRAGSAVAPMPVSAEEVELRGMLRGGKPGPLAWVRLQYPNDPTTNSAVAEAWIESGWSVVALNVAAPAAPVQPASNPHAPETQAVCPEPEEGGRTTLAPLAAPTSEAAAPGITREALDTPLMRSHLAHLRHCAASGLESGKSAFFGFLCGEVSRLAKSAAPASRADEWRVGEFWSSADPDKTCLMLSHGAARIANDGAHASFIRWVGGSTRDGVGRLGDPLDGWISVDESLPQARPGKLFSKSVLVVNMDSRWPEVFMSELTFDEEGPTVWRGASPTHWKDAPALPRLPTRPKDGDHA